MSINIEVPYQNFIGLDGKPLTGGLVYIGTVSLDPVTNPIPIFWDEAMTIPASQPLITNGGYIVRTGTPSRVYANSDYSMSVKTLDNTLVYYSAKQGVVDLSLYAKLANLAATAGSSLIGFIQAGTGAVLRTMQSKARDIVSIRDFGAVGDGVTDDTAATQSFINYCISTSRAGYVPTPSNSYRLTSPINVVGSLNIYGDGCAPYKAPQTLTYSVRGLGSWFFIDHVGIGFNLNNANETTHVTFDGLGTYRTHAAPGTGWAPTVSDYDFKCSQPNGDYFFKNLVLLNPYRGIFLNGRCTVDDVRGQPMFIGIWGNLCGDTTRFTKVHWWPYWSTDPSVKSYQLANTRGFWLNRLDNPTMQDCFSLWLFASIQLSQSTDGSIAKFRISNCDFDGSNYGIWIDSSVTTGISMQISNLSTQTEAGIANGIAIFVEGSNSHINIVNMVSSQCIQNAIRITGGGNRISIANFKPINWNLANTTFAAIEGAATNFIRIDGPIDFTGGNGAALYSGAAKFIGMNGGNIATGTTDSTGRLTVTHNLRLTPGRVMCQLSGPDSDITIRVDAINSTTFIVRCYLSNAPYVSGTIAFYWNSYDVN